MQLALLLDCCASGVFSGRRIGRAIYRDICGAVLYRRLLRSALPHCTLRRHRREATPAVLEQVLALAQALELLPLGTLRLDETPYRPMPPKDRSLTDQPAEPLRANCHRR